jgi:hypothetical protein
MDCKQFRDNGNTMGTLSNWLSTCQVGPIINTNLLKQNLPGTNRAMARYGATRGEAVRQNYDHKLSRLNGATLGSP